mmetsp:Transcript_10757/g.26552  ORF Transcript_10757/g.26552 Transcript_10757/m.26552 type:complete len:234 (-) Transcript_10757:165-866(-)
MLSGDRKRLRNGTELRRRCAQQPSDADSRSDGSVSSTSSSSDSELLEELPSFLVSSLASRFSMEEEVDPSLVVHPEPDDPVVACSKGSSGTMPLLLLVGSCCRCIVVCAVFCLLAAGGGLVDVFVRMEDEREDSMALFVFVKADESPTLTTDVPWLPRLGQIPTSASLRACSRASACPCLNLFRNSAMSLPLFAPAWLGLGAPTDTPVPAGGGLLDSLWTGLVCFIFCSAGSA